MKSENPIVPPKKKKTEGPRGTQDPRTREKEKEKQPAAAEDTRGVVPPARSESPSGEEANGSWKKPITNQDAQEKITNQGTDDTIPVE